MERSKTVCVDRGALLDNILDTGADCFDVLVVSGEDKLWR